MEKRILGRLGRDVGVVGLGAWQLGADWGEVSDAEAAAVLDAAVEAGVTFIDTADVYGDGRSERSCGELLRATPSILVATKMGRRVAQLPENYNRANFLAWNDRSRRNLGVDVIDLVQLHCPPTPSTTTTPSSRRSTRWSRAAASAATASRSRPASRRSRDRPAQRRERADHPQLLPPEAARAGAAGGARRPASGSSRACRSPRACSPAATTSTRPSRPTTTAPTTATASPSTSARPSRAFPSRSA